MEASDSIWTMDKKTYTVIYFISRYEFLNKTDFWPFRGILYSHKNNIWSLLFGAWRY